MHVKARYVVTRRRRIIGCSAYLVRLLPSRYRESRFRFIRANFNGSLLTIAGWSSHGGGEQYLKLQ